MKKTIFSTVILAACSAAAIAADAPPSPAPKGTVCFSYEMRNTEKVPIGCKGLGRFFSIAEIYERGYRVVSSTTVMEGPVYTVIFFIEERK